MPELTPNYSLALYDSNDGNVTFLSYTLAIAGTETTSNFYIIDTALGSLRTRISTLENKGGVILVNSTQASANTYTATVSQIESYADGQTIALSVNVSNTGACTLAVNSLGAKTLKKYNSSGELVDLSSGNLRLNNKYLFMYESNNWILIGGSSEILPTDLPSGIDVTKLADGTITNTEFQYLNNVSSNIQTQLNNKEETSNKSTLKAIV